MRQIAGRSSDAASGAGGDNDRADPDGEPASTQLHRQRWGPATVPPRMLSSPGLPRVEQEPLVPAGGVVDGPGRTASPETATGGGPVEPTSGASLPAAKVPHMSSSARLPTPSPRLEDGTRRESTPPGESGSRDGHEADSQDSPQQHRDCRQQDGTRAQEDMPHPRGNEDSEEDDDDVRPLRCKRRRTTRPASIHEEGGSDSSGETESALPKPKSGRRMAVVDRQRRNIHDEDVYSPSQDSDGERDVRPPQPKRRKRAPRRQTSSSHGIARAQGLSPPLSQRGSSEATMPCVAEFNERPIENAVLK